MKHTRQLIQNNLPKDVVNIVVSFFKCDGHLFVGSWFYKAFYVRYESCMTCPKDFWYAALHGACAGKCPDIVAMLLRSEMKDDNYYMNRCMMEIAIIGGDVGILKLLESHYNLLNTFHDTNVIYEQVRTGNVEMVEYLISKNVSDLTTALTHACRLRERDIFKRLKELGATKCIHSETEHLWFECLWDKNS